MNFAFKYTHREVMKSLKEERIEETSKLSSDIT
jgi:hypothetical protein